MASAGGAVGARLSQPRREAAPAGSCCMKALGGRSASARGAGHAASGSGSRLRRTGKELGGKGGSASSQQHPPHQPPPPPRPPPPRDSPNSGGPDWLGGAGELAGGPAGSANQCGRRREGRAPRVRKVPAGRLAPGRGPGTSPPPPREPISPLVPSCVQRSLRNPERGSMVCFVAGLESLLQLPTCSRWGRADNWAWNPTAKLR